MIQASPASPVITVQVALTFEAYFKFLLWHLYWQMRFVVPFAIFAIIAYLLTPIVSVRGQSALTTYLAALPVLILPGFLFVFLPLTTYLAARKIWRESPDLNSPVTYHFSDEGIEMTAGTAVSSSFNWKYIRIARKGAGHVLLATAKRTSHLIPLSAFQSTDSLSQFLKLVEAKVAKSRL